MLGLLICLIRMFGRFGALLFPAVPVPQLLGAAALTAVIGILLAGLATVLPALRAARLASMEAMRVE
jgi:ABC-type lipoprotein release transport system permease subunit